MSKNKEKYWLTNISDSVVKDAKGPTLDAYLIALEGWRRGLTVKWYVSETEKTDIKRVGNPRLTGRLYSLTSGEKTHFFFRSRGDLVTTEAIEICKNKEETKKLLTKTGIPTPEGRRFKVNNNLEEIKEYALSLGFPLVVKPTNGSLGKGVIADIQDEESLDGALSYVINELKYKDIIVEKFFPGKEYRIFVIGDNVVGAVEKLPPNVVGNGKNTIEELIREKNKLRKKNPHLSKKPIKIDYEVLECIKEEGYSINDVLEKGKQIYLRKKNSLSSGGDPIDATDNLTDNVKKIAVNAIKAIPNLIQGGLDVIVHPSKDKAVVIEINATAIISSHLFPEVGEARDVPTAIIDYYFPETQHVKHEKTNLYFDFKTVKEILKTKAVKEVEIAPIPVGKLYSKKYVISGKVQKVGYRKWVRKKALELGLHGYTKNLSNGKVIVVVASPDKEKVERFKNICLQGPSKAVVTKLVEKEWDKPVKIGFEIKNSKKKMEKLQSVEKKYHQLLKEKKTLEKELNNMRSSRSWKITKPIRKISSILK